MSPNRYKYSNPNLKLLREKRRFRLRISPRMVVMLILLLIVGTFGVSKLIDALYESRAERFERWLRQTSKEITRTNWKNYRIYTVFPKRDFLVRYAGRQWLIAAGDTTAMTKREEDIYRYLGGSKITLVSMEINDEPEEEGVDAIAKIWVEWTPPRRSGVPLAYSSLGAEVKAVEPQRGKWKAVSVKVFSTGEMVDFMGKHVVDFLKQNRR